MVGESELSVCGLPTFFVSAVGLAFSLRLSWKRIVLTTQYRVLRIYALWVHSTSIAK